MLLSVVVWKIYRFSVLWSKFCDLMYCRGFGSSGGSNRWICRHTHGPQTDRLKRTRDDYLVLQYVTFYCISTNCTPQSTNQSNGTPHEIITAWFSPSTSIFFYIPVHMAALRATARGSTPCDCALSNSYISLVLPSPSIQLLSTAICPVI